MKILVLSDTHVPRVAQDLPKKVYEAIDSADMIFHAGDFVDVELMTKLSGLKKLCAVYGNMDPVEMRRVLRPKEVIAAEKVKIGLIHGYGPSRDLPVTVMGEFSGVDAIVFGHSHQSFNAVKDGVLMFNPGSPTDTIFATSNSYGILEITGDKIEGKIIKI